MKVLGIDIGGTGIKACPVDLKKGVLIGKKERVKTPRPSTPKAVADVIEQLVQKFNWTGPIGCGFPGVIRKNVVHTAANLDKSWIGVDLGKLIQKRTGVKKVAVLNDADAAGVAEMRFGAGKNKKGTVILLTVGTGIGTAIFTNGQLLANTEFGHLKMQGKSAEKFISGVVREEKGLSWKEWSVYFDNYLERMNALFWPDLYIIGGGGAKVIKEFTPYLKKNTVRLVGAKHKNKAGILGAAAAVENLVSKAKKA